MNIQVIAVGKVKENYLNEGINEYLKRLKPYANIEIKEVPDEKAPENLSQKEEEQVKRREGEKILALIKPGRIVAALAIEGKNLSSEQMAGMIAEYALAGKSDLTFVIGGSLGLHSSVTQRADFLLSFGKMTFPHQLMRMMLVEQVYRAFRINRGEPYHK
ncbi:MAG TPA: 23S rRNA (pseudouridine(1915)-N(3))-methyltransferase RlmH [Desulfobacteria bacterium]|nr:23S rRNA (pseudouridine(1915)-N(3))-methyltransferase RlmH [Desulfobacteria bacterium]